MTMTGLGAKNAAGRRRSRMLWLTAIAALILSWAGQSKAELIVNGGFETGNFSGWSVNSFATSVQSDYGGFLPYSGNYFASLGNIGGLGSLRQTVSTSAGATYLLSMRLGSDGETPNAFRVDWNGTTVYDQTDLPSTSGTYQLLSFYVLGTGSDTLTLYNRDDLGYLALDNVSIVPEIDPATGGSALSLVAGVIAMIEQRRRRGSTSAAPAA